MTESRDNRTVGSRVPVAGLALLSMILLACGKPDATADPAVAQTTLTTATLPTTTPPAASPTTDAKTTDTVPIEAQKFAEAAGVTPERAEEILLAQAAAVEALQRMIGLLGDDFIDFAFSSEMERADEVTLYVVDEAAVEKALNLLEEVGLDPDKTTVEVATPKPPESVWDWQDEEPYSAYEWLEYPGPMMGGLWHLVSTDGGPAPTDVTVAFYWGAVWGTGECSLGSFSLSSLTATLRLTIDTGDCPGDVDLADPVLSAVRANKGQFQVSASEGHLIWTGLNGGSLTWERPDPADEFVEAPTIADDSSSTYTRWAASLGPMLEGSWSLHRVGGEIPAAPVTLDMNSATWQLDDACNRSAGVYGVTTDGKLGLYGSSTQVGCTGPLQIVEDQIDAALPDPLVFDVDFEDETMTWAGPNGGLVWRRTSQTPSG